jgi:hypothetical protein
MHKASIRQPTSSWFCTVLDVYVLLTALHTYVQFDIIVVVLTLPAAGCCSYACLITTSLPLQGDPSSHAISLAAASMSLLTADVGACFLAFYQPDIVFLPAPTLFILP